MRQGIPILWHWLCRAQLHTIPALMRACDTTVVVRPTLTIVQRALRLRLPSVSRSMRHTGVCRQVQNHILTTDGIVGPRPPLLVGCGENFERTLITTKRGVNLVTIRSWSRLTAVFCANEIIMKFMGESEAAEANTGPVLTTSMPYCTSRADRASRRPNSLIIDVRLSRIGDSECCNEHANARVFARVGNFSCGVEGGA